MSHREFDDPKGQKWEVWLVLPTSAERRKTERRRPPLVGAPAYAGQDRRVVVPDRRVRHLPRVSTVNEGYEGGWLCFESSDGEKRRLMPVPEGWDRLSESDLLKLCTTARRVVRCGIR